MASARGIHSTASARSGHRKPAPPTNRELTVGLVGAIVRFTLDIPNALLGPEEITSRQLLIWLRPIVEKLGKLIERIRHVCQQTQTESGEAAGQPPPTTSASGPASGFSHPLHRSTPVLSVENNVSDVSGGPLGPSVGTGPCHGLAQPTEDTPCRKVYIQRDGNYAIRETTERRGPSGTFQRVTKTISGPDVAILMSITSQLSELPALTVDRPVGE
ncbi:uncharacterized protein LOC126576875 [Anopheles aquasalis]|uniref:uncharacterized protein LOC126576875 n=1 Tax=Anopheles aquasalis TaxID=42839 RepID=UPI00215A91CE|nr:uncharacterized protein LOC126576875 [Anopheles aquasalis]